MTVDRGDRSPCHHHPNADTPNCWHRERNNLDQTIVSAVLISRSPSKRQFRPVFVSCFKGEQSVYDEMYQYHEREQLFLCKVYRIKLNEWDVDQWERNSINAKRLNYKTCLWVNIITSAEKERPRLRISNPHSLAYFKYFTLWCHRRRRLIATLIVSRSLSRRRILDDWLIIRWELIMRESIWRGSLWWPFVVCLRILEKLMMWNFLRNNFGFSDRPMFVDLFQRKKKSVVKEWKWDERFYRH